MVIIIVVVFDILSLEQVIMAAEAGAATRTQMAATNNVIFFIGFPSNRKANRASARKVRANTRTVAAWKCFTRLNLEIFLGTNFV
jgi:hypothetical protein